VAKLKPIKYYSLSFIHSFLDKYLFISISLLLNLTNLYAQDDNPCNEITNRKAVKLFNEAMQKIGPRRITNDETYGLLIESIKAEPEYTDAYYVLGEINYKKAQKALQNTSEFKQIEFYNKNFIKYFSKVIEYCPQYNDYSAYFFLGKYFYEIHDFKKSKEYLEVFKKNSKIDSSVVIAKKMCKHIDTYYELVNNPVPFNPVKVEGVNTNEDEYLPLISPDGEYIFYTHEYVKKTYSKSTFVEEFTYSERTNINDSTKEIFSGGSPMQKPFNQGINQGAVSITIDNNHLYISLCEPVKYTNDQNEQETYINCDIYVSDKVNDEWQALKNLGPNINGRLSWEGQPSISSDGKTLYFASSREGGYGAIDIFYSTKDNKGNWTKAKNMGNVINTYGNDKSPFIHSDSQTLYFSSDGRYGVGGFDIYFSKYIDDKWTEPKNIGYPINDENDNLGFIVSTNGKKAYFSSNNVDSVNSDFNIYSFDLYDAARPQKVIFTKGQLEDDKGNILTDAKIIAKSTLTSKITEGMVDSSSGKYALAVSYTKGEDFTLMAKKDSFAFSSAYIKTDEAKIDKPIKINLDVAPIEIGKTVKINNIQFETNEAVFDRASKVVLDNFADFLRENPKIKIEIHGHTDNVGNDQSNQSLSEKRAKSVRDYLVFVGIDSKRIIAYKGYGESKPITTNDTPEGRALNRRTEFVIVDK